jgi:hypothetical protein
VPEVRNFSQPKFCRHFFLTSSPSQRFPLKIVYHRGLRYINTELPCFVIFSIPCTLLRFDMTSPAKCQYGCLWTEEEMNVQARKVKTTVKRWFLKTMHPWIRGAWFVLAWWRLRGSGFERCVTASFSLRSVWRLASEWTSTLLDIWRS